MAVGREIAGRAGHQVDIEFVVSIVDATLSTKIRVDDAHTLDPFPSIKLGTGYVKELRALLEQHFNLAYPKVEEEPADDDTKGAAQKEAREGEEVTAPTRPSRLMRSSWPRSRPPARWNGVA